MKCRMAHAGANAQLAVLNHKAIERCDAIDVDEMRGTREAERHDGNEALAARQHASVLARDLGKRFDRLIDGLRRVIAKRRGLHLSSG